MRLDVPAVWILKSPRIMTGERERDSKPGAEISEERVGKTRRTGGDHSKRSGGELQSMSFSDPVGGGQERDKDLEHLEHLLTQWCLRSKKAGRHSRGLQGMQCPQGTQVSLRTIIEREGAVQRSVFTEDFSDGRVVFFSKNKFITYLYFILACVGSSLLQGFFVFSLVAGSRGSSLVVVLGLIAVAFLLRHVGSVGAILRL